MTIMIPRGYENEDNFVDVFMNGRSYRIPKGKEVEWPIKPMSNADRIRAMSDEELADVIANGVGCVLKAPHCMDDDCTPCILRWLKQPAEEVDNEVN